MFNQKILCIGNETEDTDFMVTDLAKLSDTVNHGLINDVSSVVDQVGYYHTSVLDLSPGSIVQIADKFDSIVLLDQSKESYPHFKSFVTTVRLLYDLEAQGVNVTYKNNKSAVDLLYWRNFLKENKSFCCWPFVGLVADDGNVTVCGKSTTPITKLKGMIDWATDPAYATVRNNMIAGKTMPNLCRDCYSREAEGLESARQFETLEWLERLSINSLDDLKKIKSPLLYELRPSNKCNIMCRTCDNDHSHLIEREWKKFNIPLVTIKTFNNDVYDYINFDVAQRIYVGGGEPTVMPEFYTFLEKCIELGRTDFELLIGTNALKFSNKLLGLLDHFSHVDFAVSIDGYKKVNDYIRWGTDFNTIAKNTRILRDRGHKISLQTVFSMYNITSIHEIFEFYDRELPDSSLLVQPAEGLGSIYMPYNHPRPDLVLESMRKCQDTKIYYMNGRSIKSMVDAVISHYSDPNYTVNVDLLRKFYEFNGKLDLARNCRLEDYIPELEELRKTYGI